LSVSTAIDIGEHYLRLVLPSFANRLPAARPEKLQLMLNRAVLSRYFPQIMHRPGYTPGVALAGATGDFPGLMADALNKAVLTAYVQARRVWRSWCRRVEVADFHERNVLRLRDVGRFPELKEGESVRFSGLQEAARESYGLAEYAAGARLTRKALLNDDTDAFASIPTAFAAAAARLEDWLAFTQVLEGNPTMGDAIALFHASHNNLVTGTLSVSSLGAARTKLARQTTQDGDALDITGRVLIVPPELSTTAEQVMDSTGRNSRVLGEPPIEVANTPFLANTQQWYLAADPRTQPAVEVAFLQQEPEPVIQEKVDFANGDLMIKCTHSVAAKAIDSRSICRSSGV
jgi:Mu-like prophage major head subunit gpT